MSIYIAPETMINIDYIFHMNKCIHYMMSNKWQQTNKTPLNTLAKLMPVLSSVIIK